MVEKGQKQAKKSIIFYSVPPQRHLSLSHHSFTSSFIAHHHSHPLLLEISAKRFRVGAGVGSPQRDNPCGAQKDSLSRGQEQHESYINGVLNEHPTDSVCVHTLSPNHTFISRGGGSESRTLTERSFIWPKRLSLRRVKPHTPTLPSSRSHPSPNPLASST